MKPLDNQKITVKTKEPQMAEPQTFNMETLMALIDKLDERNNQRLVEAIRELKKPSPEEQEKLDKTRERERVSRVSRVREAVQDEHVKRTTQFYCSHIKHAEGVYKQEHAFRGQVNNDNCCRPQCIRCNKLFPPFKVTEENMKSGMSLQNIKNLTAEALYHAHMKSFPDCPECKKGLCAVGDLRQLKAGRPDPLPTIAPDGKVLATALA